jgi:hypothetical protein
LFRAVLGAAAGRTLLLAVLRGALLDLLATGDTARVTAAVDRHLHAIGGSASAGDAKHRTVTGEEH